MLVSVTQSIFRLRTWKHLLASNEGMFCGKTDIIEPHIVKKMTLNVSIIFRILTLQKLLNDFKAPKLDVMSFYGNYRIDISYLLNFVLALLFRSQDLSFSPFSFVSSFCVSPFSSSLMSFPSSMMFFSFSLTSFSFSLISFPSSLISFSSSLLSFPFPHIMFLLFLPRCFLFLCMDTHLRMVSGRFYACTTGSMFLDPSQVIFHPYINPWVG